MVFRYRLWSIGNGVVGVVDLGDQVGEGEDGEGARWADGGGEGALGIILIDRDDGKVLDRHQQSRA